MTSNEKFKYYRLSVPIADESVLKWAEIQSNLSVSLRMLIKDAIQRRGYTDILCSPVMPQPKRGRPVTAKPTEDEAVAAEPVEELPVATAQAQTPAPQEVDYDDGFVDPARLLGL